MADNKIQMPQSGGGLVRYFDDFKSKVEFSPKVMIGIIVIVIILEFILHKANMLGF